MKENEFLDGISHIGSDVVERFMEMDHRLQKKAEKSKSKKIWIRLGAIAACLALIICIIPLVNSIFDGANTKAPVSINYDTLEEMNRALSKKSLYNDSTIDISKGELTHIAISFIADQEGKANMQKPTQARIDQKNGDDSIRYYILFDKDDIEDSYIGGYEEQNLSFVVNGITVHYSTVQYKTTYETQAKFVYDGNIYVIDVTTTKENFDIKGLASNILS